jgi:CRISPR system Cascade subunit CasB
MSEARFRRLLQADDRIDCLRRLTRAVKMLKGKANVADLAEAVWYWNDRTKRRWAFTYLDADPPDQEREAAPTTDK